MGEQKNVQKVCQILKIDFWYEAAINNGAIGGKVVGAGGGGFLMFYTDDRDMLRKEMKSQGLEEVRFKFDFEGTKNYFIFVKLIPCIILCGGIGSRLSKVVNEIPKCLAPINGIPFLLYKLKYLENIGISEVFLSVGHLGYEIKKFVKSLDTPINIIIVDEGKNLLGTGGAAKKSYKLINGPAFLTYGDTFLNVSYADVYKKYQATKNPLMTIFKKITKNMIQAMYF